MEASYGFESQHLYPKLYNINYSYLTKFSNKILIDPKSVAVHYSKKSFEDFFNRLIDLELITLEDCLIITSPNINEGHLETSLEELDLLPNISRTEISNIFEYINAIFSCKTFVCVASGSCMLASAIKKEYHYPKIYSLITSAQWNQKIWISGVDEYFIDGKDYDDYRTF